MLLPSSMNGRRWADRLVSCRDDGARPKSTVLVAADERAYQAAVRYLKAAKKAAGAADAMVEFEVQVAGLHETHRRRPSLIARLDKAGFV